ncbi:MAG: metallophosphoesterase family protein [Pelosinus sp.]|nr:metallophosphoesterase family protein [Pelosinus sp.]
MRQLSKFFTKWKIFWLAALLVLVLVIRFWPSSLSLWPSNITLTWTGNTADTETVTWQTCKYIMYSKVEYAERGVPFSAAVLSGTAELVDTDMGCVAVHSIKLTHLKPGTAYRYRVGNGFFWSPYYSFTTAPAEAAPFSFLLFGDSQGYSFGVWQDTLDTAYNRNSSAAFMMNIGDLVDMGLSYRQWDEWFHAGRGVIETIPIMAVMGNHETYNTEWKIVQPLFYTAFLRFPDNGPPELKGKVYSFDYGDAHFTILDTQRQEEEEWIPNMLILQQEWLKRDLSAAAKRWKLVFMHRPAYHNRLIAGDEDLQETFAPVFERYNVDVVFAGHDHAYARSYPISKGKWSDEKGEGPVYITTGRSGDRTFAKTEAKSWNAVFYNPINQPNYLTVAVSERNLQINVYQLNGEIIDSWGKTKN